MIAAPAPVSGIDGRDTCAIVERDGLRRVAEIKLSAFYVMNWTTACIDTLHRLTRDHVLTGEEVWLLAKWLNEHPEATQVWPGRELAVALATIFQDAQIDEAEMMALAELIAEIERKWALESVLEHDETEPLETFEIESAFLPRLPKELVIESEDEGVFDINLWEHRCTCPDWVRQRHEREAADLGRCCKHVAAGFLQAGDAAVPGWLLALCGDCVQRGRGTHPHEKWLLARLHQAEVLVSEGAGPWSQVFAPDNGVYHRFVFNAEENRWSYGNAPRAYGLTLGQFLTTRFNAALRQS